MLMASSFAGMGFGNAGVHICHGLSYPIRSQGKKYADPDYPSGKKLIPHGETNTRVVDKFCQWPRNFLQKLFYSAC